MKKALITCLLVLTSFGCVKDGDKAGWMDTSSRQSNTTVNADLQRGDGVVDAEPTEEEKLHKSRRNFVTVFLVLIAGGCVIYLYRDVRRTIKEKST